MHLKIFLKGILVMIAWLREEKDFISECSKLKTASDIYIYLKFRFPFMRLSVRFLPRLTEEENSGFPREKSKENPRYNPNVLSVKILVQKCG